MKNRKLSEALADSFFKGKSSERQKLRDNGMLLKTKKQLGDGPPLVSKVGFRF